MNRVHAAMLVAGLMTIPMAWARAATYTLEVFAPEHKRTTDPETGAELLYLTTAESRDINLYFHDQSWLADGSMILFQSDRDRGGVMGYIVETGELARLHTPEGGLRGPTAARHRNSVFAIRGDDLVELSLVIEPAENIEEGPSRVITTERVIAILPPSARRSAVNESSDGQWLSVGLSGFDDGSGPLILIVHTETGEVRELCRLPEPPGYASHVQWSLTNPHLLSFASYSEHGNDFAGPTRGNTGPTDYENRRQRLWVVDIREGVPRNVYHALEGELVTHESWWVDDTILFSGGTRSDPPVEQHVKVLDIYAGTVRIAGAGAWWPDGDPAELARWSWWHAAGSECGRWVVADNFHGDLMLFEGATGRPHPLAFGLRTFGRGPHLHPGWDRSGEQVVITTDSLGSSNVCVVTIPERLQRIVGSNRDPFMPELPRGDGDEPGSPPATP